MRFFGFDESQMQWAGLMKNAISNTYDPANESISDGFIGWNIIPAGEFWNPFVSNWQNFVTSEFGYRIDPINGGDDNHTGIDIKMPLGTNIMAVKDGTVTKVVYSDSGYGNRVIIDHGDGLETLYAHCSRILVEEGQEVKQGDVIAKVGSSGKSTGPHLHFEVRVDGKAVNPRLWLS
jgi:murein DD-endopeptidase MepM/ murein hydrolase activator NlpD